MRAGFLFDEKIERKYEQVLSAEYPVLRKERNSWQSAVSNGQKKKKGIADSELDHCPLPEYKELE